MNKQEISNKMSVNEHGTVVFDFSGGFDEKDLADVLTVANQKATESISQNVVREGIKATLERRKYITRPDVIRHPDGVLEIPLDN